MSWIRVEAYLVNHDKVIDAAAALGVPRVAMLGHLVALWGWVAETIPDGNLARVSPASIAVGAHWERDPQELVAVLVRFALLDKSEDGALSVHDWMAYNVQNKKAQWKRKERARKSGGDKEATKRRPRGDIEATVAKERYGTVRDDTILEEDHVITKTKTATPNQPDPSTNNNETPEALLGEVVEAWNEVASGIGLPVVRQLTPKRRTRIKAALKPPERRDAEWWRELFSLYAAPANAFLRGDNSSGWRADFDFALKEDAIAKVLEGAYERGATTPRRPSPAFERREDRLQREANEELARARRAEALVVYDGGDPPDDTPPFGALVVRDRVHGLTVGGVA